jgi:hypothetical protein
MNNVTAIGVRLVNPQTPAMSAPAAIGQADAAIIPVEHRGEKKNPTPNPALSRLDIYPSQIQLPEKRF